MWILDNCGTAQEIRSRGQLWRQSPSAETEKAALALWRERARIFGPAALLSLAALIVTFHFVQPAPPRHIVPLLATLAIRPFFQPTEMSTKLMISSVFQ
jgi:hypothetical protein